MRRRRPSYILTGEALPGVYDRVLELLRTEPVKTVLDLPAGAGLLSAALSEAGFQVVAGDVRPAKFGPSGIAIIEVDMNGRLPWQSASFDGVVCVEGIEHLESVLGPCRELFRVLKPGGVLVITTPNVANLWSRVKFLLRGTFYWFDEDAASRFGHLNPIPWFELEYVLQACGFQVEVVTTNRLRVGWMWPGAILRFMARFLPRSGRSHAAGNRTPILAGEILVIKARRPEKKPEEPHPVSGAGCERESRVR
ncbi:MAG: class I SAM-dependent methyltransferase [bacterium]